jgi:hypothetical protein
MISADGHDNLMPNIPENTIYECSKWFIKELAMYPESVTENNYLCNYHCSQGLSPLKLCV